LRNMSVIAAPAHLRSVGLKPGWKSTFAFGLPDAGACIAVGANNKRWYDEYRLRVQGVANKEKAGLEGTWGYTGQIIENGVYVRDKWPMPMHMIFDEEARLSGPLFSASFARRVEGYECSEDNSVELSEGWITEAASIKDLETKLGREPDPLFGRVPLEETIERWNGFCAAGRDLDFDKQDPNYAAYGRPEELLKPVPMTGEPVYAVEVFPRCLNSQGGMLRNTKSQVLDRFGEPIPRLYSGGENGDVWTWIYQCMSNVGGGCFGYGRVAGQNAAGEQPWDEA